MNHLYDIGKPRLRLRQVGDMWQIVRVKWGRQYADEVVATGLTRKAAEQMLRLAREE